MQFRDGLYDALNDDSVKIIAAVKIDPAFGDDHPGGRQGLRPRFRTEHGRKKRSRRRISPIDIRDCLVIAIRRLTTA